MQSTVGLGTGPSVPSTYGGFSRQGATLRKGAQLDRTVVDTLERPRSGPIGSDVLIANPRIGMLVSSLDTVEIAVTDRDQGRIKLAGGYKSHGEHVRRGVTPPGAVTEVWPAATKLVSEAQMAAKAVRKR
jgi:hypothetical protein